MRPWIPKFKHAFLALAPHALLAGPLCRAVADGKFSGLARLRDICTAAGLAESRSSAVEAALKVGESCGLFTRFGGREWRPEPIEFSELATALEAVALYSTHVHVDVDLVEVVLTPPSKPSKLGDALRTRGWIEADLEYTEAIARHLATQATARLAILSPFIDFAGIDKVIALFQSTRDELQRVLITRCIDGVMPPPLSAAYTTLTSMGIAIHNYWIPRSVGYETFHAKVILADELAAYVGSENLTLSSASPSMELGILLKGNSVKTLAKVVDAILSVSPRM